MPIIYNKKEIESISYGKTECEKVYYNGILVFEKSGEKYVIQNGTGVPYTKVPQEISNMQSSATSTITDATASAQYISIKTEQYNSNSISFNIYPHIWFTYDITAYKQIVCDIYISSGVTVDHGHTQLFNIEVYTPSPYKKIGGTEEVGGSGSHPYNDGDPEDRPFGKSFRVEMDISNKSIFTGTKRIELIAHAHYGGGHAGNGGGEVRIYNVFFVK